MTHVQIASAIIILGCRALACPLSISRVVHAHHRGSSLLHRASALLAHGRQVGAPWAAGRRPTGGGSAGRRRVGGGAMVARSARDQQATWRARCHPARRRLITRGRAAHLATPLVRDDHRRLVEGRHARRRAEDRGRARHVRSWSVALEQLAANVMAWRRTAHLAGLTWRGSRYPGRRDRVKQRRRRGRATDDGRGHPPA